MKSRIKTNSKSHIVIAFGTGIAAARSLEAAMLFSRAGFDIHPVFLKEAELWLGTESIRHVCNHSIAGCNKLSDSPKWFVPTWKGYDLGIYFEPNDTELQEIFANEQNNKSIKHINQLSKDIIVCSSKNITNDFEQNYRIKSFTFPNNQGLLSKFYCDLFSYSINLLYNKNHQLSYSLETNFQDDQWQNELIDSLKANAIYKNSDNCDIRFYVKSQNTFSIELLNKSVIQATISRNGIIIKKDNIERLLPKLAEQNPFNRLIKYLITESQRI